MGQDEEDEYEPINQDAQETTHMPVCDKAAINKENNRKTSIDATDDDDTNGRQEGNNIQGNNIHRDENKEADKDKRTNKKGYI